MPCSGSNFWAGFDTRFSVRASGTTCALGPGASNANGSLLDLYLDMW